MARIEQVSPESLIQLTLRIWLEIDQLMAVYGQANNISKSKLKDSKVMMEMVLNIQKQEIEPNCMCEIGTKMYAKGG